MLAIGAILLVAELGLQWLAPSYTRHLFDREFTGGNPIAMSSDGFRSEPIPREKESGEYRVLCLGDSVTFGTGVSLQDIWPSRLRAHLGQNAQTLNTAIPGSSVGQIAKAIDGPWQEWNADAFVLVLSGNMVSLAWMRRDETPTPPENPYAEPVPPMSGLSELQLRASRLFKELALPSFLSHNTQRGLYWLGLRTHQIDPERPGGVLLAHGWRQGGLDPARAEDAWHALEDEMRALKAACQSRPLVVLWSPPRFTLSKRLRDNEKAVPLDRLTINPADRLAAICDSLGVPFIDLAPALKAHRTDAISTGSTFPTLYIPFDYSHYNAEGHDIVSQVVADALRKVESVP